MAHAKAGIGRITAAGVAAAAMLPYLTIKILWMTGSRVGIDDPGFGDDPALAALNAVTFGMGAVALTLAVAFTTSWGMRLPAWLVLVPMFVGTGLLGDVVAVVPLAVLLEGPGLFDSGGPIQPWVYAVVYLAFLVQGVGLMVAFALYARDRWPAVVTAPLGRSPATATARLHVLFARGVLAVTVPLGGLHLYWAFGGTAGLAQSATRTLADAVQEGYRGLLTIAAGLALLAIAGARRAVPFWRPLLVAWLGAGGLFAWGLYGTATALAAAELGGGPGGAIALVRLLETLTGLAMAVHGAFLLTERAAAPRDPGSPPFPTAA